MAHMPIEIDLLGAGELLRGEAGSPRTPHEGTGVQRWSIVEVMEAVAVATSSESRMELPRMMLAPTPATAITVLEEARGVAADVLMEEAVRVPPLPFVAAPSAPPRWNSTVEAARRRMRGPTLTEQRVRAAKDAQEAEEKRMEQRKASKRKAVAANASECGVKEGGSSKGGAVRDGGIQATTLQPSEQRGRARLNAPLATGCTADAGGELARRSRGLEAAGEYRRSKAIIDHTIYRLLYIIPVRR